MSVTANKLFNFVDCTMERLLKRVFTGQYPLQPIFVEKAIEKAITENTKVFKNGVLPPNRINIFMNKEDYESFRKIEVIYTKQLERSAIDFMENQFKEQTMGVSNLVLSFGTQHDLAKGDVEIRVEHDEAAYEMKK